MKSKLLIGISFLLFCSCKSIIGSLYGMNGERKFENVEEYKKFVLKQYGIKGRYLLLVDKQENYSFISHIGNQRLGYFYGIFINDSSKIKFSSFLSENKSCNGRVLQDVFNSQLSDTLQVLRSNLFSRFHFINTEDGSKYTFSNNHTKKIVLIVAHGFGRMGKSYKQIQDFVENNKEYELVVISLDNDDIKNYRSSYN